MGVIGDDAPGSVIQLTGKGVDITADILKAFLSWLVNLRRRHLENVLAIEQSKTAHEQGKMLSEQNTLIKNMRMTMDAKMAIQEGRGLISAQALTKSGEPLTAGATALNAQQQKEFARLAKKYGLTYTLIKNDYDPSNKKIIMFAQKDLQKVKDITDRMTENAQIREIDKRINNLMAKGTENFTKQDYQDLTDLEDLRDSKITAPIDILNKSGNEKTFEEISGELKKEQQKLGADPMTFERALNHITSRDYSSDESYYLVERTNPNIHIKLDSKRENFDGEDYTKTDYSIYKNGEKVGSYDDGRFEGRQSDYWKNLKTDMKRVGEFTDDVVIFKTKGEFDQYAAAYNENIIRAQSQELGQTLYDTGAYFDDSVGEARDYQSDELAQDKLRQPDISDNERLRLNKALVISDQIKIIRNIEIIQNEEARINYLLRSTAPNTREHYYLTERLDLLKTEERQFKELGQEKALMFNKLCSVEALQGLRNIEVPEIEALRDYGREVENGVVSSSIKDLSKTDWKGSIDKARQAAKKVTQREI